MDAVLDRPRVWTFDDLQSLPEDVDPRCYEIVDGALVVSPSPTPQHEYVAGLLRDAISPMLPPDLFVVGSLAVELGRSYRIPDLLVVPKQVLATEPAPLPARDVVLAAEIISPSSVTTDRITKPAQYATAGIRGYWRVETEPQITLTAYALAPAATAYTEIGTWEVGEVAEIAEPIQARILIDALLPTA